MSNDDGQSVNPPQQAQDASAQPADPSTPPADANAQAAPQAAPQEHSGGLFGGLRDAAEGRINSEIDQLAGRIPGGDQFSQQAKDAAAQGLGQLEQEGESKLGNSGEGLSGMLGGLFGGGSGGNEGGNQGDQ
jgi:hypothetical protein